MPLPGSRVIHSKWSEHHRPVAEGTMTAVCTITRAGTGPGTFDPNTGITTPPATSSVFIGACRTQEIKSESRAVTGEQQVTTRDYLVAIVWDSITNVKVDDVVMHTVCDDDPTLVGRPLRVRDVMRGSLLWERDLIVSDDLG